MKAELPVVGETCGDCRWWKKIGYASPEPGWCHRQPPILLPHTTRSQAAKTLGGGAAKWEVVDMAASFECDSASVFGWPATTMEDFCGEWAVIPAPAGG